MSLDKNIEELIDKYYNGGTSLEEEKQLQDFFQGEDIPDHLKAYQSQFKNLKVSAETTWPAFTEDKLFGKLEKELAADKPETKVVSMRSDTRLWFYRIAAAVALIFVGYYVGTMGSDDGGEISIIREELAQMKAMMFDQLDSRMASARMQGVNQTFAISEADDEILDALIGRMNEDKNLNVKLKAIESLSRFGEDDKVRTALVNALGDIEEPAIQIALINVLVELKEKSAIQNLEKITQGDDVLKEVRDEAHLGIFKLKDL